HSHMLTRLSLPRAMFRRKCFMAGRGNSRTCKNWGEAGALSTAARHSGRRVFLGEDNQKSIAPEKQRLGLWLDLLNEGIGTESEPEALWEHLEREFSQWPGFRTIKVGSSRKDPNKRFQEKLRTWLKESPDRRVLLLLDEADRFLERDATN